MGERLDCLHFAARIVVPEHSRLSVPEGTATRSDHALSETRRASDKACESALAMVMRMFVHAPNRMDHEGHKCDKDGEDEERAYERHESALLGLRPAERRRRNRRFQASRCSATPRTLGLCCDSI